jgi:hypothetical protein
MSTTEGDYPQLPSPDPEWEAAADAEWARWTTDLDAGRERVPDPWEVEGPAVSISLGAAGDVDPALLAVVVGPDGRALGAAFGQGAPADALRPGPVLAALAEQAVSGRLSDDERAGVLQAAQRLQNRAAYLRTVVVADFARDRMAQFEDARARRVPLGRRPGEFPAEELAAELLVSASQADRRIECDLALTGRLPRTLAALAAGVIDSARADVIAAATLSLSDADAAHADAVLAPVAPGLRVDQLARKADALEMKLNPEAVKARKEHARQTRRRVEVRREDSGNACIAAREVDPADALASKAYVDGWAVRVRNAGLVEGSLPSIRALVAMELLQGRDPLNLTRPRPAATAPRVPDPDPRGGDCPAGGGAAGSDDAHGAGAPSAGPQTQGDAAVRDPDDPGPDYPGDPEDPDGCDDPDDPDDIDGFDHDPHAPVPDSGYHGPDGAPAWTRDEAANARRDDDDERPDIDDVLPRRGPLRPGESAPPPAAINLIIPIGTLLGWSAAPAQAGGFGLLDPQETQTLVAAASRHPRTRWSVTIVDPTGRAIAHGRARGQHPWNPPPPPEGPPGQGSPQTPPGTSPPTAEQLARLQDLLRTLNITTDPIAQADCDHGHAESHYIPGRRLRDLLRARSATCDAPGCNAQAQHCDQDHTIPYPQGRTCECNLGPKCRRHHRAKQAPGWRVERPEPGTVRWTLPNGRTHTTHPTTYDT